MNILKILAAILFAATISIGCSKQKIPVLIIDVSKEGAEISRNLWGIFYEEISRAGEGGLYPEMIYNRAFEEKNIPPTMTFKYGILFAPLQPSYAYNQIRNWGTSFNSDDKSEGWVLETKAGSQAVMTVVTDKPYLDPATPHSLLIDIKSNDGNVRLLNEGFRGIALKSGGKYDLLFHARAPGTYNGKIVASLIDSTGTVIAKNEVDVVNDGKWNPYPFTFASDVTDNKVRLSLQFTDEGKLWLDYFSLLPQTTFMNHGLRQDMAQILADLKPGFIRWPGGCVVEGCTMEDRIKWWESIGPRISRGGVYDMWGSTWGYYNNYGFGYHEFLQFCEDIGAVGMFVANAGVSCSGKNGDYYEMKDMHEIVEQTLGALEYALGDITTKWGAERARNGHPEPFHLKYVEIGNENSGPRYGERYNMIYKALKEKYPQLTYINTNGLPRGGKIPSYYDADKIEMFDPHYYNTPEFFFDNVHLYDTVKQGKYDIYIGEYACNTNVGTGTLYGALSEAAFMTGIEHNSDLVKIASYAPLLENVNYRAWPTNLIRFSNDSVFGRSSYYVQKMFSENRPDVNLASTLERVPHSEDIIKGRLEASAIGNNSKVIFKNVRKYGVGTFGADVKSDSTFDGFNFKFGMEDNNNYFLMSLKRNKHGFASGFSGNRNQGQNQSRAYAVNLSKVVNGKRISVGRIGKPFEFILWDWHNITLTVKGNIIESRLDDITLGQMECKLNDRKFDDCAVSLDVMRDSAFNGFETRFGVVDDNNYFLMSLAGCESLEDGSFIPQGQESLTYDVNISKVENGRTINVGRIGNPLEFKTGEWHNLKFSVKGNTIGCSLDNVDLGQTTYRRIVKQYAIAGYDRATSEIIVKVVNGEGNPFNTTINISNAADILPVGQIITLSSLSGEDENDFDSPTKISPQTSEYSKFSKSFKMEFRPYSFTILRIKAKKM